MVALFALWLPILLSAVFVFIASSVIHMVSPWHKSDYPMMKQEDAVMDALRPLNVPPGDYMVPRPKDMKDMRSPGYIAKLNKGPKVIMTVLPNGMPGMTKNLVGWFLYSVVVNIFAAYVTSRAVGIETAYLQIFRFVGTVSFVGYTLALWQMSIWYSRSWGATIKSTVDGLIYALLTAGTFGWLWPR
jgi:hypothetical protein